MPGQYTQAVPPERRQGGTGAARLPRFCVAIVLVMLATAPLASPAFVSSALEPDITAHLRRLLGERAQMGFVRTGLPQQHAVLEIREVRRLYERRGFAPLWIREGNLTGKGRAVVALLREAPAEGLMPSEYDLSHIEARLEATRPETLAELELLLSTASVRYAKHLGNGRLRDTLHPAHHAYHRPLDIAALLQSAGRVNDAAEVFRAQAPRHRVYSGLRQALAQYRRIAADGGWPALPAGPDLRPGDRGPRIALLRERLRASGDLGVASDDSALFDSTLEAAVSRFQERYGLESDGVVGPKTRAALNVPVGERIRQLALNLERARWLPYDLGERYVLVNIAGFWAEVIEKGHSELRMKVIVGKAYQQTPAFSDEITYLELNPYWNVPRSIAVSEILPAIIEDPEYLSRNNMEVIGGWEAEASVVDPQTIDWESVRHGRFPYRFRQKPGSGNALGRVKFMFPNDFSVYMHDTPARHLFQRDVRTFSHGCIRVSQPLAFARYLLGQRGWSQSRIQQVIDEGTRTVVPLRQKLPVHVTYLTAWEDGRVHFRADVYGRDARLAGALFDATHSLRYAATDDPLGRSGGDGG